MNTSNLMNVNLASASQTGMAGSQNNTTVSTAIQQVPILAQPSLQIPISAGSNMSNAAIHSAGGFSMVSGMKRRSDSNLLERLKAFNEDGDFFSSVFCGVCPRLPGLIPEKLDLYPIEEVDEPEEEPEEEPEIDTYSIYEDSPSADSVYSQDSMEHSVPSDSSSSIPTSSSDPLSDSIPVASSSTNSFSVSMDTPPSSAVSSPPESSSSKDSLPLASSSDSLPASLDTPPSSAASPSPEENTESILPYLAPSPIVPSLDVSKQRPVSESTEDTASMRRQRNPYQNDSDRRMARIIDVDLSYEPSPDQLAGSRQQISPQDLASYGPSREQLQARYNGTGSQNLRRDVGLSYIPSREQLAARFIGTRQQQRNLPHEGGSTRRRARVFDNDTQNNVYRCAGGPYVLQSDPLPYLPRETRFVLDAVESTPVKAPKKKQNKIKKCFKKLSKVFRICGSDL